MSIESLMAGFSVKRCGLCCNSGYQCESCLLGMLGTAGLGKEFLPRVRGKTFRNPAYQYNNNSEVILEMRKILKEVEK